MNSNKAIKRLKSALSDGIGRRMASGAFWMMTGTAMAKLIVLVSTIICARILTKEIYGEFEMVKSTLSIFVVIGGGGIGAVATKYISQYRKKQPQHAASIYVMTNLFAVCIAVVLALLVFIFSEELSVKMLRAPQLTIPLKWSALFLIITVFNAVETASLSGFEDFKSIAINTLVGSAFEGGCMLLGAWHYGLMGALIGYFFGFFVQLVCNKFSINRNFSYLSLHPKLRHIQSQDKRLLINYALPATVAAILAVPTFWFLRTLIVRNVGFGELAVYSAGDTWRLLILFVPGAVSQIVLPILSSIVGDGNENKFWKVLKVNVLLNATTALLIAALVCASSKLIMSFYGPGYERGIIPLLILASSTVFNSISVVLGSAISSLAKMWWFCVLNIFWAAVMVGLGALFLHLGWGIVGASLAVLVSYISHSIIQYVFLLIVKRK